MKAPPMTASIKEALEPFACIPLSFTDDIDDSATVFEYEGGAITLGDLRRVHTALSSLSCGEARERIARIIDPNAGWGVKLDSDYLDLRQEQAKMEDEQRVALRKADAILATGCVPDEASIRADQIIMSRALVEQAHAAMLETGWHLAPAHATSGDGVIEAAVAEIEERFAAAIRAGRGEG